MTLRIGIDATTLANTRGFGRYTRELLGAMLPMHRDVCWVLVADARARDAANHVASLAVNAEVIEVPQSVSPTVAAAAEGSRSPMDMLRFTRAVARARLDAFFSPTVYAYFPLPPGVPLLVCFHDMIAERFPELTLPSARARLFWQAKSRLALAQCRLVLTSSENSARDIAAFYRVDPNRIRVALAAPAAAYQPTADVDTIREVSTRVGVPDGAPWFTYVGGFNPHKHVDVLVRAHAQVVSQGPASTAPHLVLVGSQSDRFHGNLPAIRDAIARAGTEALVHWAGFMSDEDLRFLLAGAVANVLASECEGFGLPAVEAAACGTPVIATTESPLPDLLPGGGHFVAPRDEASLVRAMSQLLTDPAHRAACGRAALAGARQLSWTRAAEVTWQALYEMAA